MKLNDSNLFRQQALINGEWLDANNGEVIDVTNPANGDKLGSVPKMGADETRAAIDAAKTQSGKLTEAYRVVVNGEDAGYAFKIVAGGSQGDIEMIVGVDADLAITGISVVDAAETSGIGTKVIANEATTAGTGALDQFVGKSGAGSLVVKTNIDAVSGATVTTKGITKGANAALAAAEAMA